MANWYGRQVGTGTCMNVRIAFDRGDLIASVVLESIWNGLNWVDGA
jgi:hypothetical protein